MAHELSTMKPLAVVNTPLILLVLLAKSAGQRSRRARLLLLSAAIAAFTVAQPPSADGIRDFPVHPAVRNLLGRLLVPVMDTMTTLATFCLATYPVKASPAAMQAPEVGESALVRELRPQLLEEAARRGTGRAFDPAQLYEVFDQLPPAASSEMVGKHYSAVVFRGGGILGLVAALSRPLLSLGYAAGFDFGKRYESSFSGHPLGFYLGDLYFPFLLWGNVTMLNCEHRGRQLATMIYDTHPYKDAFVRLGEQEGKDVLLGTWEVHGKAGGFFILKEK